jgi:glycosyltransferase involved in cell wall biosynthesis
VVSDTKSTAGPAKRVAVLLPSMMVGGAERLVVEELSVLKDDPRFAVELHLVFDEGPLFQSVASLGIPIHVWNAPHKSLRMLKSYVSIVRYLRLTGCDILHSHLLDGIGPLVGKLAGAGVVATVHSDKPYSALERFVLATSDLVLACGTQVKRNIDGFVPSGKVGVLSNAIRKPENGSFRRDDVMNKYGFRGDSRLVLSLGRLIKLKGFDVLIEAFQRVVAELPDAVMLIGGDGEEKVRLMDMVKSAGLSEQVGFPGVVSETHEVLAACDLYVNSSRWEGLPMTLLEAMAHGKPMIATNVGGNSEVVQDGVTGMLVPPEDPQLLADAIIRMLKDDGFREDAGNAAFTLFSEKYTIDKHCEALAEYYSQVMQYKVSGRGKTA